MNLLHSTPKSFLRGELFKRGMTLRSFALRYGFPVVSVEMTYRRHCGNYDSNPYGKQARAIIRKLHQVIHEPVENFEPLPGDLRRLEDLDDDFQTQEANTLEASCA